MCDSTERERLNADIAALRKALAPFAACYHPSMEEHAYFHQGEGIEVWRTAGKGYRVKFSDFAHARAALAGTPDSAGERMRALERVAEAAQWLVDDGVVQIGEPLHDALAALRATEGKE